MNDKEILKELKEKADERDLGVKSINYYYALKHAIGLIEIIQGDKFKMVLDGCTYWINQHEGDLLLDYNSVKQLHDLLNEMKEIIDNK